MENLQVSIRKQEKNNNSNFPKDTNDKISHREDLS